MKVTPVDALTARRLELALPLNRQALEKRQMSRLRETVNWARSRSPFYRAHLSSVDLTGLRSLQNLDNLPFLDPADLRRAPLDLLSVSSTEVSRIVTLETSGSTGQPKRIFFTNADLAATSDFFYHGMLSLISENDGVLVLLPHELPDGVGDLLLRALAGHGVRCAGLWPLPSPEELAVVVMENAMTSIVGLPLHLLELAEALPINSGVGSMLLCSDYAPPALRQRIETACGCKTFLHYGMTETGLGGGVECDVHQGCHLRESELLVEIVDPAGTTRLPDGRLGEIVVTTLQRRGMPLIRYRTGDLARIDRGRCECGGVTARLCDIRGRLAGCELADGGVLQNQDLDDSLFAICGIVDFRASLHSGTPERMTIEYRKGAGYSVDENEIRAGLLDVSALRKATESGSLAIAGIIPVDSFAIHHTIKRTIKDLRTEEESK
jgi:phenylacetate-coenzyme A ligase PaaK-like adenylate-forming protein